MKIGPALSLTAALLLTGFAAQAGTAGKPSSFLNQSAQALTTEDWAKSAHFSLLALDAPDATASETMTALNNLCIAQTKLGRFQDALATCDKSVKAAPNQWANYINRGNLLVMSGNLHGAVADYERAKQLNPESAAARHAAAITLLTVPAATPSFVAIGTGTGAAMRQAGVRGVDVAQ